MPRMNPKYAADTKLNKRGRPAFSFTSVKRTVGLVTEFYPRLFPAVCVLILFSSAVSAIPAVFTQKIIAIIGEWTASGDWETARGLIVRQLTPLIVLYLLSLAALTLQTQVGAILTQGFRDYIPETTKLIIAQRVASVEDADLILVMDGGKIVESGTHETLMASSVIYRETYEPQTKSTANPKGGEESCRE